jgi:glucosylceramidase
MTHPRLLAVCATAVVAVATGGYVIASGSPSFAATTANVWLTTPDRANLLSQKAAVTFGTAGSGSVITVNPNTTYQSMVGFGASFTDAAAYNVFNSSQRNSIMTALFSPTSGIGLSWLRQPIGATDFSRSFYTYDDGAADPSLSRFSIAHDQSYILPLVTQARSLNSGLSIMATPWSAPAWMKTNNNLVGGSLSDANISAYADYLVKFVQAYQAAGAPIAYLSVQNEPQFSPPGYPGMLMSAAQQSSIINNLAPKLRAAGLGTKILGWDHNWDNTSFAQTVNTSAGSNVAGSAWHCYGGDPGAQSTVHNAQPAKDIFFTECSGTESANTFADSLWWQGRNLAIGTTRNWARTVTTWNMALDANHGPVIGSCTNCTGVTTVNGGSVTYNAEYYVLGHLSKFVKPSAVRIDSTGYGQGGIENVAFRNPDGTIVLVAINTGGTQNFQVSYSGASFGYNLPAGSMATFTWPGTGSTTPTTPPAGGRTGQITGYGGKCVDVAGANSANGTAVQLYTCNGSAAQQWTVGTDGTLRALGKCLDVTNAGTANGTRTQIWDCAGGTNQRWTATGGQLVAANSSRCLDATGPSSADGTPLQIWDCGGGANQQWALPS